MLKTLNYLFDLVNYDGCKHIILATLLMSVLKFILPLWIAAVLVLLVGIFKELYDMKSGGCSEWKDIICNIIGILIGII